MSSSAGGDVIIADHDSIVRSILRSLLEGAGFTVLPAGNGVDAVSYAERTNAQLVILDYKMPGLDGCSACAQIRQLPGYSRVPVLMLTAFDDQATRAASERAGASAFVTKPFRPIDLLQAIATLVGRPVQPGQPAIFEWGRSQEPAPLFGEPALLAEGRRVLNICRR